MSLLALLTPASGSPPAWQYVVGCVVSFIIVYAVLAALGVVGGGGSQPK